jgi:hypothetical protein
VIAVGRGKGKGPQEGGKKKSKGETKRVVEPQFRRQEKEKAAS